MTKKVAKVKSEGVAAKPKASTKATAGGAKSKKKPGMKVSPLAPKGYPMMPPVGGVRFGTTATKTKYKGRDDLLVAVFPEGTSVAGVFTTSKTAAAPVDWCRAGLENGTARGLVVNAGNANAFTGKAGMATVRATAGALAGEIGSRHKDVFISSTGVIGEVLDPAPLEAGIKDALSRPGVSFEKAARAIMTTDTYAKFATREVMIGGVPVRISGIAKGSGMIAPDLATMLVYIFTDAAIPADMLQNLLMLGVRDSFNCITVDSDTSTSDTVLMFATGEAMRVAEAETGKPIAPLRRTADPRLKEFRSGLDDLMLDLSHQVVKDGEGATKFIKITVQEAASYAEAKQIALSVANSPLVKTAIAGEDANWGRIVMAVGKSGAQADRDKLAIRIGGVDVAKNGVAVPGYDEAPIARHMKGSDIDIEISVGIGKSDISVWTCDLTYEYIRINADYRS